MSEADFIARARQFLVEVGGVAPDEVDPDTDLVGTGVMDSLLLVAFLAFVEEQRGAELDVGPEQIQALATLRSAYALL